MKFCTPLCGRITDLAKINRVAICVSSLCLLSLFELLHLCVVAGALIILWHLKLWYAWCMVVWIWTFCNHFWLAGVYLVCYMVQPRWSDGRVVFSPCAYTTVLVLTVLVLTVSCQNPIRDHRICSRRLDTLEPPKCKLVRAYLTLTSLPACGSAKSFDMGMTY